MSQIYSKITVGLGLAGIFLYGFYRKILNGDNFSGSEMSSNQNMHVMRREMLQQMQRTQETVVQLQRELEALRRQIRYNNESIQSLSQLSIPAAGMSPGRVSPVMRDSVTIGVGTHDLGITQKSEKESEIEVGTEAVEYPENPESPKIEPEKIQPEKLKLKKFEQATYVSKINENYARSTQVHFISKRRKSKISNFEPSSKPLSTRSDSTMISSRAAPTPASDDDAWITPQSSESETDDDDDGDFNFDSGITEIAAFAVHSLQSLTSINSMGEDYKFIAPDMPTYTPLPSKHLPMNTRNLITKIDKLTCILCPGVDKNVEIGWDLLMENKSELSVYLELTWRVCRAAVYLRTYYLMLKNSKKASFFVTEGVKYAKIGDKIMSELAPYNTEENLITENYETLENYESEIGVEPCKSNLSARYELYQELKITALAPMTKWAGSIFGVSAEIAPGVQEKITVGFKARDYFKKSIKLDPFDYFTYYNLARWHWEIYNLPGLLKRSANWISAEPFNSGINFDVLPTIEECLKKFPKDKEFVFKVVPADIYLMKAFCLRENGDKQGCKKFSEMAKKSVEDNWAGFDGIGSTLDEATLKDIEKLLQKC